MGLTIKRVEKPYTIFDALNDFLKPKERRTLMLINWESGIGYKVVAYDPKTSVVKLSTGPGKKKHLHPHLTDREAALYYPLWR